MSETRDVLHEQSPGFPFTRQVAQQIVQDLFCTQAQWKTGELVQRVIDVHRQRRGILPNNPSVTINRALVDLKREGKVSSIGHGWWRWAGTAIDTSPLAPSTPSHDTAVANDAVFEYAELEATPSPVFTPEVELGVGKECVYLYYNPNDQKLAKMHGQDVWECKIGRTSSSDPNSRILGQGIRTAQSRQPILGLVIKTDNAVSLETALHQSLRLVGAKVEDSPGNEWFTTSPARVKAWFGRFQESLNTLRGE
ncbi:MAG: GIY-YIG nuclease family protein [Phycisphaerales bacterium]|nr:GIY-YIG nuclease family protein [Phycisphaerales bacterium]